MKNALVHCRVAKRDRLHLRLGRECRPDVGRQALHCLDEPPALLGRQISRAAELQREQREGDQAARVRLGRRHRHLWPRVHVDPSVDFPGDAAADHVDDAEHAAAAAAYLLHRHQGVDGLARLADRDVERVALDDGVAIAELPRRLGRGGDAREGLDEVRAGDARVVGRAAAEELDPLHVEQLAGLQVESAEVRGVELAVEPTPERALDRLRLIENLLVHVVRVSVAFVGVVFPFDGNRELRDRPGVHRHRLEALGIDHRDFAVVEVHHLPDVAHERGDVGRWSPVRSLPFHNAQALARFR